MTQKTYSAHRALEEGELGAPGLVVHGGAGTFERLQRLGESARAELESALAVAMAAGWEVLEAGGPALDSTVEAVAALEDSGLFNAGRGSVATIDGAIETDASVMDGATGTAGGVCAATWPANPVRAARLVADLGVITGAGRPAPAFQPVLLAGYGADSLAKAAGLAPMMPPGTAPPTGADVGPDGANPGTVGAVALDAAGHLAAATSTGGRPGQPRGRVGDSCIIGAGTWADDTTVAVSGTGTGEQFILAGFAHRVDWALQGGGALGAAMESALLAVCRAGGTGGAIALSPQGRFAVVFATPAMARGWRDRSQAVVRV